MVVQTNPIRLEPLPVLRSSSLAARILGRTLAPLSKIGPLEFLQTTTTTHNQAAKAPTTFLRRQKVHITPKRAS